MNFYWITRSQMGLG